MSLTPDQSSRLLGASVIPEREEDAGGDVQSSTPMAREVEISSEFENFARNVEEAQKRHELFLQTTMEEDRRITRKQKERLGAVEKLEQCRHVLETEIAELKLEKANEIAAREAREVSAQAEQEAMKRELNQLRDEKDEQQAALSGLKHDLGAYREELARVKEHLEQEKADFEREKEALRVAWLRDEKSIAAERASAQGELERLHRKVAREKQDLRDIRKEIPLGDVASPRDPCPRVPSSAVPLPLDLPARMAAVQPEPYSGKQSWGRWLKRFQEDMNLNGWNESQRLHALRRALRDGPGEEALTVFDQTGDGTFAGLTQVATRVCGKLSPDASLLKYKGRAQMKDETLRLYALDLRRLAGEAFGHPSGDTLWYRNELHAHFVNGIRDPELREVVRTAWLPRMTLDELCEIGEYHEQKKLYSLSPSLVVSSITTDSPSPADRQEEILVKSEGTTVGLEKTIEGVVKRILGRRKSGNKNKIAPEDRVCYKCQVKGHIAKNCPSGAAPEKEEPKPEN